MPEAFPFIDLMSELQSFADKNKSLSSHEIAREFVLAESARRGGVEVIVATDKDGKFLGAGTQNSPYLINFPPSIKGLLNDPKANMILHHNHPPDEKQYFSDKEDMGVLARHSGIGWMLLHTEQIYAAMRATNRMFQPGENGMTPGDWLTASYQSGWGIARCTMYDKIGVTEEVLENGGPELALRALQRAGAIEYHSNIQTGLSHEHEESIIRQIRQESADIPGRTGGNIVWTAPEKPDVSATSGRIASTGGTDGLSTAPPVTLEFNRFVDFISRQNAVALDAGTPGGSQPSQLSSAGGENSGLASGGSVRRPVLETGLRFSNPRPV